MEAERKAHSHNDVDMVTNYLNMMTNYLNIITNYFNVIAIVCFLRK